MINAIKKYFTQFNTKQKLQNLEDENTTLFTALKLKEDELYIINEELNLKESQLQDKENECEALKNEKKFLINSNLWKDFYYPVKQSIECTGSTPPDYNGFLAPDYKAATGKDHYGIDLNPGWYTAIGDGVVDKVYPTNVGGGIVIRHSFDDTHDLLALYWHGKPGYMKQDKSFYIWKVGDKVTANDYVTDSSRPDKSIGTMGKHTHFELRIVPKGHKFEYYDKYRPIQALNPTAFLTLRDGVKLGDKIKKYIEYTKR